MNSARAWQGLPILTPTEPICIVPSVAAKSVTRLITPEIYKAQQSPYERLFCCNSSAPIVFMVGLMGPTSVGPVSLYTGGDNPISPATKSELSLWVAGSLIQGVCFMAIYRLAVLHGDSAYLNFRTVHHYETVTTTSYKAACIAAESLGAIVVGWRAVR